MSTGLPQLYYQQFGSAGPDLIILHGLLGSGDNWRSHAKRLAGTHRVFCLDLRNHGRSFHAPEMDYPVMARDVYRFITEYCRAPVRVLGHSMGGKGAMELALEYPDRIESLVVVDISPFEYEPVYSNVFSALLDLDLAHLKSRRDADELLSRRVPDRMLRLFLLKNLKREKSGKFRWKINLEGLSRNYRSIWAGLDMDRSYTGPALFIEGGSSDAGIGEDWEDILQSFPAAQYTVIEEAGHWVHSERPDRFYDAVSSFFGV